MTQPVDILKIWTIPVPLDSPRATPLSYLPPILPTCRLMAANRWIMSQLPTFSTPFFPSEPDPAERLQQLLQKRRPSICKRSSEEGRDSSTAKGATNSGEQLSSISCDRKIGNACSRMLSIDKRRPLDLVDSFEVARAYFLSRTFTIWVLLKQGANLGLRRDLVRCRLITVSIIYMSHSLLPTISSSFYQIR